MGETFDSAEPVRSAFEPLRSTVTPEGVQEQAAEVAEVERANAEKERQLAEIRARKAAAHTETTGPGTTIDAHTVESDVETTADSRAVEITSSDVPTVALAQPTKLTLGKLLGKGAHAEVYEATLLQTGRRVAVKRALPGHEDRLIDEARVYGKLEQHPHLLGIESIVEQDGYTYGVMRLAQPARQGFAHWIMRHVGHALQYAHDQGVLHRDIKRSNILCFEPEEDVSDDVTSHLFPHYALADFGLALEGVQNSQSRAIVGTPGYMAPELFEDGAEHSVQSDLYALAATVYEILAGRRFLGDPEKKVNALPREEISEREKQVLIRALSENPEERFATVRDFYTAWLSAHNQDLREARECVKKQRSVRVVERGQLVSAISGPFGRGVRYHIRGREYDRFVLGGGWELYFGPDFVGEHECTGTLHVGSDVEMSDGERARLQQIAPRGVQYQRMPATNYAHKPDDPLGVRIASDRHQLEVGSALGVGAILGTAVAAAIAPPFWWLGTFIGGGAGFLEHVGLFLHRKINRGFEDSTAGKLLSLPGTELYDRSTDKPEIREYMDAHDVAMENPYQVEAAQRAIERLYENFQNFRGTTFTLRGSYATVEGFFARMLRTKLK